MTTQWSWWGVQGRDVGAIWADVWPMLKSCVELDDGRYDEKSLKESILAGDMQLWLAGAGKPELAVTTELRFYPRQLWCNIKYVGGKGLPYAFDFLGTIEAWAKTQGCVGVEGWGRPEWARLLLRHGYRERGRSYQRKFA